MLQDPAPVHRMLQPWHRNAKIVQYMTWSDLDVYALVCYRCTVSPAMEMLILGSVSFSSHNPSAEDLYDAAGLSSVLGESILQRLDHVLKLTRQDTFVWGSTRKKV